VRLPAAVLKLATSVTNSGRRTCAGAATLFAYPGTGGPETAALHWLAVFDTLSDRLQGALGDLRKRGKLDEEAISRAMREVRLALLEADVNFEVVKDFVARVRERALGADVAKSLTPGQQVVKIVHEEVTALMGSGDS
jgi:signal recognition particle GTPase